jgi:hypothetical protein
MSRGKKTQVDDLTKLRRILDTPSDPSLKNLITKNEPALESVRRRLLGDLFVTKPWNHHVVRSTDSSRFLSSTDSLEPRVTIRPIATLSPSVITSLPSIERYAPLPEFQLVPPTPPLTITSPKMTFVSEDLFEVEHINRCIPEFLEIIPKQPFQEPQNMALTMHDQETSHHGAPLPEWQPVSEEQAVESKEPPQTFPVEDIPEFERVDTIETVEEQKSSEAETRLQKEEPIEPPVVFIPVAPPESAGQEFSRQQKRAARKARKQKERDARRQQKLEMKRLKQEKREQEREAKRAAKHPEKPSTQTEFTNVTEIPVIQVDYNNFTGIKSIDDTTAELLYKHGYFSIENLRDATVDDLTQIPRINRKLARQIKTEIDEKGIETETPEFIPKKHKKTKKKEKKKPARSTEWEPSVSQVKKQKKPSPSICTYKEYTLYRRKTKRRDGKKSAFHYFAKKKSYKGSPAPLPEGYHIVVNKKNGVPYLKKKR